MSSRANLIVKGDVDGSIEALMISTKAFYRKVQVNIIQGSRSDF